MRYSIAVISVAVIATTCAVCFRILNHRREHKTTAIEFPGDSLSIPIRFINDRPVIDVTINGEGPFALLLDTAATNISLEESAIEQLALPECGSTTSSNAAGMSITSRQFGADLIEVGDASLKMVAVLEANLFKNLGLTDVQGIWGMLRFGERIVIVDLPKGRLYVQEISDEPGDSPDWLPIGTENSTPEVSLEIGERDVGFLIDTGSQGSLSVTDSVARAIPLHERRYYSMSSVAGGARLQSASTRLTADITLGRHTIERPYVSSYEDHPGRNLIGMDILKHFRIELDMKRGRCRFIREETTPITMPDKRRLGLVIKCGDEGCVVSYVSPGREKVGDLKIDDHVITVDDHPPTCLSGHLGRELQMRDDPATFIIERNGEPTTLSVHLLQDSFDP